MSIIPMRDLKNTVEVERRCAEENGPVYVTKNGYGVWSLWTLIIMSGPCRRCTKQRRCWMVWPM